MICLGYTAGLLAEALPDAEIHGIDLSPDMLRVGRRSLARRGLHNVTLLEGDASAVPLADGTLDLAWNTATDGLVSSLAVDQGSGAIYVGGNFTQIGSQSRNRIARLAANGSVDAGWDPSANGLVYALALHSSGALYAGGAFDQIGGQPRNRIAKLTPGGSGAADANWNPSANDEVRTLALASGVVYAGGSFTTIGGHPRKLVAKLADSGTGAADASWNPSAIGSEIRALAVDSSANSGLIGI